MLFGAVAMGVIVALTSSFHSTVTAPQDAPTAIMALIAAGIVTSVGAGNTSAFATVVAAMAFTALATGLTLWLLGHYRLGNLIRFIPYPVVGGFLAGTGWVLLTGALRAGECVGRRQRIVHRVAPVHRGDGPSGRGRPTPGRRLPSLDHSRARRTTPNQQPQPAGPATGVKAEHPPNVSRGALRRAPRSERT